MRTHKKPKQNVWIEGSGAGYCTTMPPQVLHPTLLIGYRAFLHKLSTKGVLEEPGTVVQQAKTKFLTNVCYRRVPTDVDPFRAFTRLKGLVLKAKTVGQQKAQEHLQRALGHGRGIRNRVHREVAATGPPPPELAELFGTNGILRVRINAGCEVSGVRLACFFRSAKKRTKIWVGESLFVIAVLLEGARYYHRVSSCLYFDQLSDTVFVHGRYPNFDSEVYHLPSVVVGEPKTANCNAMSV